MTRQEKINKIRNATNNRINYILSLKNDEKRSFKFLEQFCCEAPELMNSIVFILRYAIENPFCEKLSGDDKIKDYICGEHHLGSYMYLLMKNRWDEKYYPSNEFYNGFSDLNKEITLYIDIYRVISDQNMKLLLELLEIFKTLENLIKNAQRVESDDEWIKDDEYDKEYFDKDLDLVLKKQEQISYVPIEER